MSISAVSAAALGCSPALAAVLPWRLGPLRFTPYGLCASAGLVAAMGLARRMAPRAKLDRDAVWDVGFFAIFSCFVSSRFLLILQSPFAFLQFPLVLLGLPSLSLAGMALAAGTTWLYLSRKHLPLLPMLDAFAAPAALLAAFLQLGHWLDGSETGMPTTLPWGVPVPGAAAGVRVQPVAAYGLLGSALLCVLLLWPGSSGRATPTSPGERAARALGAGGALAFALDMLSVPPTLEITPWLEPGQWLALLAMLAAVLLWTTTKNRGAAFAAAPALHEAEPLPSPLSHKELH